MKYLYSILLLIALNSQVRGQNTEETLNRNIKLLFFNDLEWQMLDACELDAFCEQSLVVEEIPSSGFKDLIFYAVPYQPLTDCPYKDGRARIQLPLTSSPCGYIVAYHLPGHRIYRISGFQENDLGYILNNRNTFFESAFKVNSKRFYETLRLGSCDLNDLFENLKRSKRF